MSRLFFISHGQASFLSDNYDQLSDTGENQAQALGEQLTADNIVFDAVFSGDLVRQVGTAEIVSNVYQDKKLRFPLIKREVGLNEYPAEEIMTTLGKYLIDNDTNASDLFKKCNDAEDESDRHKYFQKLFELILEVWVNGDYEDVGLSSTWEIWSNQVRETLMKIMENSGKGKLIAVFTSGGP
ncbi:MAG: histidine phosphatase family protein, partial [Pseudomonadota bacterium]|nr:histidine phosphatase family protein [Pseudomonadota bacterium]